MISSKIHTNPIYNQTRRCQRKNLNEVTLKYRSYHLELLFSEIHPIRYASDPDRILAPQSDSSTPYRPKRQRYRRMCVYTKALGRV